MAETDLYAKYTCSFKTQDGAESGSGIIVQIDPEDLEQLLQEPSCLKKKVGDQLSADKRCYALITAHSCVYADYVVPDEAVQLLTGRSIVVGNSENLFEIPIENSTQCCAVSCCGKNSIMRLTEELPKFTLMPHRARKCNMGFDFLILFLKADAVNKRKPIGYPDPPPLQVSLAQCQQYSTTSSRETSMYMYQRSEGMVKKVEVSMEQPQPALVVQRLRDKVDSFMAKRSIAYQRKGVEPQISQIGAPIVRGSYLIGINTGEEVTTIQGIFQLLKGGIIPFLAVMRHPNPRQLLSSRWKEHVSLHVKSLNRHDTWDLLHHLLEEETGIRILKINYGGFPPDIISGLEILTAVFDNLKTRSGVPFDDYHRQSDGEECKCMSILYSHHGFIKQYSRYFAQNPDNEFAIKMVEAFFQCFESMLNCESIARKLLSENIQNLIVIATSQLYVSNAVVSKCFRTIILIERTYLIEKVSRHYERCDFYVHCNELEHSGRNERLMSLQGKTAMVVHGRLHSNSESQLVRDAGPSQMAQLSSRSNTDFYLQPQEERGHK